MIPYAADGVPLFEYTDFESFLCQEVSKSYASDAKYS